VTHAARSRFPVINPRSVLKGFVICSRYEVVLPGVHTTRVFFAGADISFAAGEGRLFRPCIGGGILFPPVAEPGSISISVFPVTQSCITLPIDGEGGSIEPVRVDRRRTLWQ